MKKNSSIPQSQFTQLRASFDTKVSLVSDFASAFSFSLYEFDVITLFRLASRSVILMHINKLLKHIDFAFED